MNNWEEHVIDSIDACHTLQVADFNNDGNLDVLAGQNQMRWGGSNNPVNLYLNKGDNKSFRKQTLTGNGIYNGLAGDLDNDGDMDIIRLSGHSAKTLEVLINQLNDCIIK